MSLKEDIQLYKESETRLDDIQFDCNRIREVGELSERVDILYDKIIDDVVDYIKTTDEFLNNSHFFFGHIFCTPEVLVTFSYSYIGLFITKLSNTEKRTLGLKLKCLTGIRNSYCNNLDIM